MFGRWGRAGRAGDGTSTRATRATTLAASGKQLPYHPRYRGYLRPEIVRIDLPAGLALGAYADAELAYALLHRRRRTCWTSGPRCSSAAASAWRAPRARLRLTASAANLTDTRQQDVDAWSLPGPHGVRRARVRAARRRTQGGGRDFRSRVRSVNEWSEQGANADATHASVFRWLGPRAAAAAVAGCSDDPAPVATGGERSGGGSGGTAAARAGVAGGGAAVRGGATAGITGGSRRGRVAARARGGTTGGGTAGTARRRGGRAAARWERRDGAGSGHGRTGGARAPAEAAARRGGWDRRRGGWQRRCGQRRNGGVAGGAAVAGTTGGRGGTAGAAGSGGGTAGGDGGGRRGHARAPAALGAAVINSDFVVDQRVAAEPAGDAGARRLRPLDDHRHRLEDDLRRRGAAVAAAARRTRSC